MNKSFRIGDYVKTKFHGNGTVIDHYIGKGSGRIFAYKIELDDKVLYGIETLDTFPCDMDYADK